MSRFYGEESFSFFGVFPVPVGQWDQQEFTTVICHFVASDWRGKTHLGEGKNKREMWKIPSEKVKKSFLKAVKTTSINANAAETNIHIWTVLIVNPMWPPGWSISSQHACADTLDVYESCGAESLCYWADGWRLEKLFLRQQGRGGDGW